MLRLIVNADDLGLTNGVNRAILQAHRDGIVTSATLMANAPAFDEAVAAVLTSPAYQAKQLGIGCHVVLIDGVPLSPSEQIRTLLGGRSPAPHFRKKLWKFALAAVAGRISTDEVELEATAQIRKLQKAGIELSHVDCHKHTHMFPRVLEGVLRAAQATGVKAIRNPFEPAFARNIPSADRTRARETAILERLWGKNFGSAVAKHGLSTTDGSLGVTATGTLTTEQFSNIIRNLPESGTYEFVCHPGFYDADLASAGTRLLESRQVELDLLCSSSARDQLRSSQVNLVNFRDVVSATESNPAVVHPMP
ncbi:YdjC-like protein [Candidatus Koribacter versatilis Ellin345]|uniref:YdjC-like protein n=1 Tax=Koribacter versatilis (strain Ellin345) TaxID=204669 RepID=Q1IJC0_KORVE|nr:ChbG/HpnK family deacetylase [Candidatus Koribacter versatilis]ABF43030.1 YdjC-like protein [Candidatus Koribacter versatilis Ellin345]